MSTNFENLPPIPAVQHLTTIFRNIDNGQIRMPAFQRDFVWSERQILELLESVYKGYPIGSILFWKIDKRLLKIATPEKVPFPIVEEKYPISFILDGMQRLSSLYGVFDYKSEEKKSIFNVIFDLREGKFLHEYELPKAYLRLSSLFSPKKLIEAQKWFSTQHDGDKLIDKSLDLQRIFQEYQIPTVTIQGRAIEEVIEIFQRINSTGTPLGTVDFMHALIWSADFDLNKEIGILKSEFSPVGFELNAETILKILAIILGKNPTPDDMLKLKQYSSEQLKDAVEKSKAIIRETIDFLKKEFSIYSYDYVPYEGQFLVLVKLFSLDNKPNEQIVNSIKKWFWQISLSEGLQGKSDNFIVRVLNNANLLMKEQQKTFADNVPLKAEELLTRTFARGRALSAAVATLFAVNRVRSLETGEEIEPEIFMSNFSSNNFLNIYSLKELQEIGIKATSPKTLPNIIVASDEDKKFLKNKTFNEIYNHLKINFKNYEEILNSQFISSNQFDDLFLYNDPYKFLTRRAVIMMEFARRNLI